MPIADAKVEIFKDSELIYTGYTDSNGKFTKTLEAGIYTIRISKTGYLTIEKTEELVRSTELMVNLPSELIIMGTSYDVSVLAGVVETAVITTSYEVTVP